MPCRPYRHRPSCQPSVDLQVMSKTSLEHSLERNVKATKPRTRGRKKSDYGTTINMNQSTPRKRGRICRAHMGPKYLHDTRAGEKERQQKRSKHNIQQTSAGESVDGGCQCVQRHRIDLMNKTKDEESNPRQWLQFNDQHQKRHKYTKLWRLEQQHRRTLISGVMPYLSGFQPVGSWPANTKQTLDCITTNKQPNTTKHAQIT